METIEEAKRYLREHFVEGVKCPCCGQNVKRWRRNIYDKPARQLINLYKLNKQENTFYHMGIINNGVVGAGGGDFAKLRFWGLIIELKKNPGDKYKRTSGFWKITQKGIAFVENLLMVPRYVYLYNKKTVVGFGEEMVGIRGVLGDKFDYETLMNT